MKTINSFRSKLFALTLALMASVSTFAYDFQSGYLFYNILPDGTVAVTSETYGIPYDYLPNSLVIPSEVNGYNGETYVVTEIANYAFSGCSMLDTLVIPNTVKKIGMYAFTGCTKLVYISFPESIEDILGGALYECAWYNNQPDGLIYIGNLLYRYKGTAPTGTIVVKDGTKAILDFTFSNQPNIQSVVLPESVTSIHIQAFGDCPNLESVVLPSKLEAIEDHTFQYCEKLTNIKLPDALKLIGKNAFIGCTNLTKLTLPSSVQIIADEAFANCTSLTEVTCYATIPPVRGDVVSDSPSDWFFAGVDVAKIPLYVPTESIDLYKKAEQWMFFNPILPIEPTTDYKSQWCDTWNVFVENGSVYPPHEETYRYQLAKDTVIGEHTYTAVVQKEINDALDAPHYVAAVRFTDDRKVYIYYDNAEYLLYDFNVQEGDELEVFAGINNYTSEIKTYKCTVTGVEQYACVGCPATITLEVHNHPDDFREFYRQTQWIEGVGDINGFLNGINGYINIPGNAAEYLLCAYKGDELKYTGPLYEEYGCGDNANDPQLPLVDWCNQWNILSHGYLGPQDPLAGARTSIYWLSNNTVNRNGQEYIPLMCSSSLPNEESTHLVGELRFTEDKQVYFYYAFDETEYLLYDFGAELGDTLELFAGLEFYNYHKTYTHVITDKETLDDGRLQIQADVVIRIDNGAGEYFEEKHPVTWIEGLGSTYGIIFNPSNPGVGGDGAIIMLCAYREDECVYTTNFSDYKNMGCVYNNDGTVDEDLFPMLAGLQRTVCNEYCGETEDDNSANNTYKQTFDKIFFENDKPYILCNDYLLREEDNKILIYSQLLNKDLVLYDFTLEVGDSLPALYIDWQCHNAFEQPLPYNGEVVDYNEDNDGTILPADTFIVTDISTITLLDGKEYKKWTFDNGMEYVEGIGMYGGRRNGNFFGLIREVVVPCHTGTHLVCVSKNNKLLYQMDDEEMERLGAECLCEAENPEYLFPTLWGLQQTICSGYYGEEGDEWASGLTGPSQEITMMDGKPYLQWGSWYLREENDKILVYSEIQKKDLVLYDFTLELGDTLTTLNLVTPEFLEYEGIVGIVDYPLSDYDYTYPIDTLVVTELSKETLLDGKEYTRWKFSDGTVYVEGIGSMSETFFHHIADHLPVPVSYLGSYLVCVSKNNKLLYMMDDAEMERLGAECLCDYDRGPRKDNAKDGQIGGRPTPTQWNQLEVVLRQMDNNHTILQAETFSYTLEDISQQVNNKTYFQLARQSTKDTATTKSFVGALHFGKDKDNRVYFLRDGVEYVLYDFTAEIGDTVEIFAGINNYPQETTYTHVVVDKDTTEDGACRMFLKVVFPEETTTAENAEKVWLAGLGSVDGIVHNAAKRTSNAHAAPSRSASSSETESSVMLCAWREDSCLYTTNHPDYETFGCVYNQDPTSVEDISTSQSSYQKIIREGQFLILHNGKTYSIMGIEL
ncbi:MAG: leucine-rich repeat domain-containing protein [Paludibacteraceae bacterium]|nr:leucine-rich repeat domain-containing protein [Paludibacteraceae bacterium]